MVQWDLHETWLAPGVWVVDRPTQLIYIWIFICWVGGGDPCGAAEFCFSSLYSHKKQERSAFFSKYPCHVQKDCLAAKNGDKKLIETSKKPARFKSLPKKVQPILGQIDFVIFAFRLTVDGVGFFSLFLVGEDKAPFPLDST